MLSERIILFLFFATNGLPTKATLCALSSLSGDGESLVLESSGGVDSFHGYRGRFRSRRKTPTTDLTD